MTKQQKQIRKQSSQNQMNGGSGKKVKHNLKQKPESSYLKYILCIATVVTCVACAFFSVPNSDGEASFTQQNAGETNPRKKHHTVKKSEKFKLQAKTEASQNTYDSKLYKNFKPHILNKLQVKSTNVNGITVKAKQLQHSNKVKDTAVRAYVLENFLSKYECDALSAAHDSHVNRTSERHPLLCFDSLKTFRQNLQEIGLKIKVSSADFLQGTSCINETLSLLVRKHGMSWSYSTSFYPGESKFSLTLQERIEEATGLSPENGGKFQITSYPPNVGYKNHTDCVVGQEEKRDRYATMLVYLKDVVKGGETVFPQLGLSVTPKKGLALVWNSMNERGECDPSSIHNAAQVIQGHKYILQRWYYYQNFPSLGKRMPEPSLPIRKPNQPRVSCDEYEFGSCRWYDEWNYEHITDYVRNQHNYL